MKQFFKKLFAKPREVPQEVLAAWKEEVFRITPISVGVVCEVINWRHSHQLPESTLYKISTVPEGNCYIFSGSTPDVVLEKYKFHLKFNNK